MAVLSTMAILIILLVLIVIYAHEIMIHLVTVCIGGKPQTVRDFEAEFSRFIADPMNYTKPREIKTAV